ncbi:NADH dehydrogenase 1 alpha subcomplex assembly factor 3 [Thelephora terrestris]|uniref:NADH dehydrogenase 1 alpha subcomplex assembly factor 3 n=1 Tax=Thelephora terrestris TaxID=56493 RepID=A0A9P6H1F5_9AGAM|nr:NADH dehydrogenase 1 alpha subcomplex assembly factor 3 [Thelephora terrestris]
MTGGKDRITILRYPAGLENILGGGPAPPVQVKSLGEKGIELANGLVIPSACIFLDGQVFLWNVPPKPNSPLGTGKHAAPLPRTLRNHLNQAGIQVDVMDTWNACSTYNLLAEEGRRVAAALLPRNESA